MKIKSSYIFIHYAHQNLNNGKLISEQKNTSWYLDFDLIGCIILHKDLVFRGSINDLSLANKTYIVSAK